jgi:hypothetical protein
MIRRSMYPEPWCQLASNSQYRGSLNKQKKIHPIVTRTQ